jgi:DNA-binding NtrC family response regulator
MRLVFDVMHRDRMQRSPLRSAAVMATLDQALGISAAADAYLHNPYIDPAGYDASREKLGEYLATADELLKTLVDAKKYREARRLLVGVVNLTFRLGEQPWPEPVFPETAYTSLELSVTAVAEVLAAGLRCSAVLRDFGGESAAVSEARAATWRACFGDSLYEAMKLKAIIHAQNVLLLGESGTGKEILARAIQQGCISSGGTPPRFSSVSAAAMPETLLESELFGHMKGAFSGADRNRIGRLEELHHGTIFLDEIADLPPATQPKLLRVLQERKVTPLGANDERPADVRVISATSQPIERMVNESEFRLDLYERLAGIVIRIPPLRERREDIRRLAQTIIQRVLREPGVIHASDRRGDGSVGTFPGHQPAQQRAVAAMEYLEKRHDYEWPGNVRELENELRARILGFDGRHSSPHIAVKNVRVDDGDEFLRRVLECDVSQEALLSWYTERVLKHCDGNKTKAAEILGIDRNTLARKSRKE